MKQNSLRSWIAAHINVFYAGVLLAAAICVGMLSNDSILFVMTRILCMALLAVSLNLQFGFGGMTNLGGGMIFSLAGYAMMVGCVRFGWGLLPSILFAMVVMAAVSLFLGYICLRNNMLTFTFCSMGLTMVAFAVISKISFLGRDTGLIKTVAPAWMAGQRTQFFVFLIVVAACLLAIYYFTKSPFMQIIVGARENDERLTFLGINIRQVRLVVFTVSGMFASVAGILYAILNSGAHITSIDPIVSIQAILMCIIGGASSFLGPVFGSVIVMFIINVVSASTPYFKAVLGIVTIFCVYCLPNGIFGRDGRVMKALNGILTGSIAEEGQ